MSDAIYSATIKAGKTNYFIDVKEAKNNTKYLSITESKFEDNEKKRKSILIFGESIEQVRQAVNEAADAASKN